MMMKTINAMNVKKEKINIYLAELSHINEYGLSVPNVPLGIGKIAAYCIQRFGKEVVDIKLFRTFHDLSDAIDCHNANIIGLGCYSWNENLTAEVVKHIRGIAVETVIAIGGQSISKTGVQHDHSGEESSNGSGSAIDVIRSNFIAFPEVDYLVHGDGELPFSNIVEKLMQKKTRKGLLGTPIDGCSCLVSSKVVSGNEVPLLLDLDAIPSPYLLGLYTEMIAKYDLIPQIETVRGCPFKCTYCSVGGGCNKLRKHSVAYVKEEIQYVKNHCKNKLLRMTDTNFGILERDVELAEYICELKNKTGYPVACRVYYAERGSNERVKRIALLFKDMIPLNISFQTLTPEVLEVIQRKNQSDEEITGLVKFAHQNGLSASTELISGLPGESYSSFLDTFMKTVSLNFDSIFANSLYLIKGSELERASARKEYAVKTKFSLLGRSVSEIDNKCIVEADEYVVENSTMTMDEFFKLSKFKLVGFILYGAGYFKEILMHCDNYRISLIDIYETLLSDRQSYPIFNSLCDGYITSLKKTYYDSLDELRVDVSRAIKNGSDLATFSASVSDALAYKAGEALASSNKRKFIDEVYKAGTVIHRSKNDGTSEFSDILRELSDLTERIIISPMEELEEAVVVESHYDIVNWIREDYKKPLVYYHTDCANEICLYVRNMEEHMHNIELAKEWSIKDRNKYYFANVVSSNMRYWLRNAQESIELAESR
ncbi:B12-binding domain-containing radical SAM protein [Planctomycetota bacterium]